MLTGQKVSFNEVGNGQGKFGALGSILGRLGLGTPRFGQPQHISNINQPNHIGDVSLVSGAVPVVIMNSGGGGSPAKTGWTSGIGSLVTAGLGILSLLPGLASAASAPTESVSSSISFGGEVSQLLSPNGFPVLGQQLASAAGDLSGILSNPIAAGGTLQSIGLGPGGTSGFAGPVGGQSGGILGGLRGLFKGGFNSSTFYNPNDIPLGIHGGATTSAGIADSLGGGILGKAAGGLAGLANSAAGAILGGSLVLNGLMRKPGVASAIETPVGAGLIGFKLGGLQGAFIGAGIGLGVDGVRRGGITGTLEAAGGGALVGGAIGGPLGAVVGAGIGAGAGIIRSLFETDRAHTKKLVKQIYGMDINNATADSIIAIAKQSFGGQISVAVRSQQVRDLLKLYAQTTGQKGAEDKFVAEQVHSASFVEAGGKLYQQAIYDNGSAYAYASPFSTLNGVQTSPLPTYAPNQGVFSGNLQISLNGQSAADALTGQVVKVVNPSFVQGRSLTASRASIGRTSQTAMTLSPSSISR